MDWNEFWREPEELVIGAVAGLAFFLSLGWWTIPVCLATAFLWKLGGFDGGDKMFRRVGVPVVVGLSLMGVGALRPEVVPFCALACFGVLSMGYGIPDPSTGDEGSWLGRLWSRIVKDKEWADACTRATIGLLFSLCFSPVGGASLVSACLITTIGFPIVEEFVQ